jgi:formamidopyrimidine-DNA glycosylase
MPVPVESEMTLCQHCGVVMRPLNTTRSRLMLYWCPTCQRFVEVRR